MVFLVTENLKLVWELNFLFSRSFNKFKDLINFSFTHILQPLSTFCIVIYIVYIGIYVIIYMWLIFMITFYI